MSDAKGPYKYELAFVGAKGGGWRIVGPQGSEKEVYGLESLVVDIVHHRNIGYAEGRASRDGLREELLYVKGYCDCVSTRSIEKALKADGEGK